LVACWGVEVVQGGEGRVCEVELGGEDGEQGGSDLTTRIDVIANDVDVLFDYCRLWSWILRYPKNIILGELHIRMDVL
jgi:hypothetical protein